MCDQIGLIIGRRLLYDHRLLKAVKLMMFPSTHVGIRNFYPAEAFCIQMNCTVSFLLLRIVPPHCIALVLTVLHMLNFTISMFFGHLAFMKLGVQGIGTPDHSDVELARICCDQC